MIMTKFQIRSNLIMLNFDNKVEYNNFDKVDDEI